MKKLLFLLLTLVVVFPLLAQTDTTVAAPHQSEFVKTFMNGMAVGVFFAYMAWALIGLVLNLVIDIVRRKPQSPDSPVKFSWKYWWADNWCRILIAVILIPVITLLFNFIMGVQLNLLSAFYIGWTGDQIAELLKRKGAIWNMDKAQAKAGGQDKT
jgi:hypothetical protein